MLAPVSGARKDRRSSFRALKDYLTQELDAETGAIRPRGEMVLSENLLSPETAAAEMRGVANENARVKDPVYHYQLCWQPGERPTQVQWEAAAKKTVRQLGFDEHQYILGAHSDTEHFHVHVMVNRVHPETYRAHYPQFSKRSLDKVLREIEAEQGWKHSRGLYHWDERTRQAVRNTPEQMRELRDYSIENRVSQRAGKVQTYADTESLEVYVKGAPADQLHDLLQGSNATWQKVHALLHHYGLALEKGDKGGYTVRAIGTDLRVKASKVFRDDFAGKANRSRIANKLGPYRAPEDRILTYDPRVKYTPRSLKRDPQDRAEKREQRAAERAQLRKAYQAYKDHVAVGLQKQGEDGRETIRRLREDQAARRAHIRTLQASPIQRRAMRSVLAAEFVQESEILRHRLREERAARRAKTYREWITEQAEVGDIAAARQLRGFLYREKRARRESAVRLGQEVLTIESASNQRPDAVFYAIANMTWVVDRRTGDVTYRLDGNDAFIDVGEKINLIDSREATLAASLKVAQEKFGSYLHVTGSDQLKREIATAAAKHGLNVRFTEDRMNHWLKIDQKRYRTRGYGLGR
jgi:hypothetical protein